MRAHPVVPFLFLVVYVGAEEDKSHSSAQSSPSTVAYQVSRSGGGFFILAEMAAEGGARNSQIGLSPSVVLFPVED